MPQSMSDLALGIIDPDPSSRAAVARLLFAHGYRTTSFISLAEYAAHTAFASPIPLLLVDVAEYLKGCAAPGRHLLAGSAVIALGAEARVEDIGRALAGGCVDYLVRPLQSALLLPALDLAARRIRET